MLRLIVLAISSYQQLLVLVANTKILATRHLNRVAIPKVAATRHFGHKAIYQILANSHIIHMASHHNMGARHILIMVNMTTTLATGLDTVYTKYIT